jgi:hypothetical protein
MELIFVKGARAVNQTCVKNTQECGAGWATGMERSAARTASIAASNPLGRSSRGKASTSETASVVRSHRGPASLSTAIRSVASARRTAASRPSARREPRPCLDDPPPACREPRSSSSIRPATAARSLTAFAPARASNARRSACRLRTTVRSAPRSACAFASNRRKRCSAACRERTPRLAAISCQLDPPLRANAMSRYSARSSSARSALTNVNASLTSLGDVNRPSRTEAICRHSSAASAEELLTRTAFQ